MLRCFQIELTKSYDHNAFHEDLVDVYYKTGAQFEDTTFLFTDNQIVQEVFLEDINNILNSGKHLKSIINWLRVSNTHFIIYSRRSTKPV